MGIYCFPTNFIYWENIENHENIKNILMNEISIIEPLYNEKDDNGLSHASTNYVVNGDNFTEILAKNSLLEELVWKPLDNSLSELNSLPNFQQIEFSQSYILNSWYTKYDKDGQFALHNHYGDNVKMIDEEIYRPTLSLIYILHDENEKNSTEFMLPSAAPLSILDFQTQIYNTGDNKEIKEGTIIVFPSSLYHHVKPVKIPGRITIAVNIASKFKK